VAVTPTSTRNTPKTMSRRTGRTPRCRCCAMSRDTS
jgi:hypothetical protein